MKSYILHLGLRCFRWQTPALAACIAMSLVIPPSLVSAEEGVLTQLLSLEANLKMQLQTYVNQSIKGTSEAMQEGPARDPSQPFTLADLQKVQQKNQTGYDTHKKIGDLQQQLLNNKAQILKELPPNDPQRTKHEAEFKQIASQLPDTRSKQGSYKQDLATADAAIDRWKQKTEPDYTPPPKKTGSSGTGTGGSGGGPSGPGPGGPTGPGSGGGSGPTGPGGWPGSGPTGPVRTGGNINTLKANEAALENEARNLGKIREAAVIKYLNDPTDENKAAAQAIKKKLDKLVGKLNDTRNEVDGLSGGSRPPLKIRTPKQIAKKAGITKLGKPKGGSGGEDHHHGPDGTDVSSSEGHHHGPDGTDIQSGQRKTKAGKQKGQRKGQGKRRKSQVASSEDHQHGPGGTDIQSGQRKGQGKGQGKRRKAGVASSQTNQQGPGGYNIASGQSQQQKEKRQRKRQRKAGQSQ